MQLSPFGIVFSSALLDFTLLSIVKGSLPVTEGNKDREHFIYMNACPSKEQSWGVLALCQYPLCCLPPGRHFGSEHYIVKPILVLITLHYTSAKWHFRM